MMKKIFASLVITLAFVTNQVMAQCAMCRVSIENNIAAGETSLGSGLNTGILYLMIMPYLMLAIIAYFWFKQSKKETTQRMRLANILKSKLP